MNKDAIASFYA